MVTYKHLLFTDCSLGSGYSGAFSSQPLMFHAALDFLILLFSQILSVTLVITFTTDRNMAKFLSVWPRPLYSDYHQLTFIWGGLIGVIKFSYSRRSALLFVKRQTTSFTYLETQVIVCLFFFYVFVSFCLLDVSVLWTEGHKLVAFFLICWTLKILRFQMRRRKKLSMTFSFFSVAKNIK